MAADTDYHRLAATVRGEISREIFVNEDVYRRLLEGRVRFYHGGVVALTGDASDVLDSFVHARDGARGYGATNYTGGGSADVDRAIEEAGDTALPAERLARLQAAMRLTLATRLLIPVVIPDDVYGVRATVEFRPRLDRRWTTLDWRCRYPTTSSTRR